MDAVPPGDRPFQLLAVFQGRLQLQLPVNRYVEQLAHCLVLPSVQDVQQPIMRTLMKTRKIYTMILIEI